MVCLDKVTSMFIRIPETAFALAKSRNSVRVTNLPLFLFSGFLIMLLLLKGLTSWAEKGKCHKLGDNY